MKQVKSIIIIIIIISFQLFGCREEALNDSIPKSISFNNPYSLVGKLHNEGLDSCLSYIRKNTDRIKSKEDFLNVSEQGVNEFLRIKNISVNQEIYQRAISFCQLRNYQMKKSNNQNEITTSDFTSLGYSDKQIIYMQRLFNLFDSNNNLSTIKDSINTISSDAFSKLDDKDAQPILITSSVMLSSLEYWSTHLDEMYKIISQLAGKKLGKITLEPIDWLQVGLADAEAAAAAAIPCLYTGPAWPECVGGAAIGASMWNATVQLINYYFSYWVEDGLIKYGRIINGKEKHERRSSEN